LTKKGGQGSYEINIEIPDKLTAPIGKADAVGKIVVTDTGKVIKEIPVITNRDIKHATYFETVKKVISKSSL
jgi:D-alanyl-D-alanine carboxypeptidase